MPVGLVAVIMVGLGVAGCSGSGSSSKSAAGGVADGAVARAAAAPTVAGGAVSAGSTSAASTAPAVDDDRAIVSTASMTVGVRDVDGSADRIAKLADRPGERVDGDQRSSSGNTRTAQIVLRVLPARLDSVITAIDQIGTEVSRNVQGEDVTATRADMNARITALSTSISRLQGFLAQSTTVPNLLAVETQLATRQGELDSLNAQQRALADQISLASLTVQVVQKGTPAAVVVTHHGPAGFGSAVVGGWHGLVVSWRWLVAVLGYALPVGGLLLIFGAAGATWWRRRRPGISANAGGVPVALQENL